MIEIKTYDSTFFAKDAFMSLMQKVNQCFTPPLSDSVDLGAYSEKLYNHALFVAAEDNGEIIGLTAYYRNSEANQLYIPLICVDSSSRSRGVGSMILSRLTELSAEGFCSIALEVKKTNIPAYQFYKKHGFIEKEDRGEKLLMEKTI